jgi:hypothetical protein
MPLFLQKTWAFVKQYWRYIAVFVATVTTFLLFRREKIVLLEELQAVRRSYEDELKKINEARATERKKNEEALAVLQQRLLVIQNQYEDAKIELGKKKKKEIEDLMKKYSSDPKALSEKLSEATGFKVILPE